MTTYILKYQTTKRNDPAYRGVHTFNSSSGHSAGLHGDCVDGVGIPQPIAQKIVDWWTSRDSNIVYSLYQPRDEEL